MNSKLQEANAILGEKRAELDEVNRKVQQLQKQCQETVDEKDKLAAEAKQTEDRLVRAEMLISGLSSEGERWKESVIELSIKIDAMVSSDAFLFREGILKFEPGWRRIFSCSQYIILRSFYGHISTALSR